MRGLRWLGRIILAAGLLLQSSRASAAELIWNGPPECALQASVREDAERLLGESLDTVPGVDFEIQVTQRDDAWHLVLSTIERGSGERRQRELLAPACRDVANAAAVAIAMAVQSSEAARPVELAPPTESEAQAVPAPATRGARAPERDDARPPRTRRRAEQERSATGPQWTLAGGVIIDAGALPNPSPGAELELGVQAGSWRFLALGGALVPQHVEIDAQQGGDFRLLFVGAVACLQPALSWSLVGCAGYEVGSLEGEGTGVARPRLGAYLWQAARVEAGVVIPLDRRLRLEARLGAAIPVGRRDFVLNGDELVHRPAGLVGRGLLALTLAL